MDELGLVFNRMWQEPEPPENENCLPDPGINDMRVFPRGGVNGPSQVSNAFDNRNDATKVFPGMLPIPFPSIRPIAKDEGLGWCNGSSHIVQ